MPRRKRIDKRREKISAVDWAFLCDAPWPEEATEWDKYVLKYDLRHHHVGGRASVAELWREHCDRVIAEWIVENPGTRPSLCWKYDAPEPRLNGESETSYLERHGLLLPGEPKKSPAEAGR
jgi:hypothetical protein